MPNSIIWGSTPYDNATGPFMIGGGGTLGMPRTDGFVDGFDTIQGVRAYNSNSGSWMTPDRYQGAIDNPASGKSYQWNDNNPVDYGDPSGNDALFLGFSFARDFFGPQYHTFGMLVDDDGNVLQIYSFGPGGPLSIFLNNNYNNAIYQNVALTGSGLYAGRLYLAGGCDRRCPWERALNNFYRGWLNNWSLYTGFLNSNSALSYVLAQAGLSTALPAWAPSTPGWLTCGGGGIGSPNEACGYFPGSFSVTPFLGAGATDMIYAIYGGTLPDVARACDFKFNCMMNY